VIVLTGFFQSPASPQFRQSYGDAWHVPNAPTETLRQLITLAAKLIGVRPRLMVLPQTLAPLIALFDADVRELAEMRFQWDRPYRVDSSKFAKRSGVMRRCLRRD
jgi:hypothetical protein